MFAPTEPCSKIGILKKNVEKSVESRTLANSARWGGVREYDDDDGGEQCELGWR